MNIIEWEAHTTLSNNEVLIAEEDRLMAQAQTNPVYFSPLYERYVDRVYAFCRKRCQSDQDAEDLTSKIFVRVLKSLHTYKQGNLFTAWLFKIARNVMHDHYKKSPIIIDIDDLELPATKRPDSVVKREDQELINSLIAQLTQKDQELLALSLQAGLTSQEIGQIIGKKPTAVRVQLHRIVKKLRKQYQLHMGEHHDER